MIQINSTWKTVKSGKCKPHKIPHLSQGCGVTVEVGVSHWRRLRLWTLSVSSGLLCNFVAVYLTSLQFILQVKLCLHTIVHFSLEEFKISLKSSSSTQSLCHTISPRVGVGVPQTRTPHPCWPPSYEIQCCHLVCFISDIFSRNIMFWPFYVFLHGMTRWNGIYYLFHSENSYLIRVSWWWLELSSAN